ncbi:MAG: tRNA (adenosine(37)-N6)-threonylcarbamoyltransferase complex ATPase subunit type 1 TsaE [Flavisolibacter sp.]
MNQIHFNFSLDTLDHFAETFWKKVHPARVFAFHGPMGAGKTTIILALCRKKGVKETMASPTFSIINQYIFQEGGEEKIIYHIDLYRLKNEEEVVQAGVEDCVSGRDYCMVEWPEKAPFLFDDQTVHVYIKSTSEKERQVEINLPLLP